MKSNIIKAFLSFLNKGFTGISFRILFFNIILIIIITILFLNLNSYERVMLRGLENNQNSIARVIAGTISWNGDLNKNSVRILINGLPYNHDNHIQVLDIHGDKLYESEIKRWETGPDIRLYRERFLYKTASDIYCFFSPSYKTNNDITFDLDYHLSKNEWNRLLNGKGFSKIRRDVSVDLPVVLYTIFPIKNDNKVIGIIIITKSANGILNAIYKIRYIVLKFFLITLLVTIILNLIISRTILKPVKKLIAQIGELSGRKNDIDYQFTSLSGSDEISQLSKSFSNLTTKLKEEIILNRNVIDEMVHEIKNPLTSIRSASEMLDMTERKEDRELFHKIIADDVSRIESLLSGVKELSIINTSRTEEPPVPIDISFCTEKIIKNLNVQTRREIKLQYNKETAFLVSIQEARYLQAIENIIQNALSFSPEKGSVGICLKKEKQHVVIEISDAGPGIPKIHLSRIFERFYSIRPEDSVNKHTGIGLSITKSIIQNAGGDISVSNGKTIGARFLINLPCTDKKE